MIAIQVKSDEALGRTSPTLLAGIKARDQGIWRLLVRLYGPLIYTWCRRSGLQDADAADVAQDVFGTVAESIEG